MSGRRVLWSVVMCVAFLVAGLAGATPTVSIRPLETAVGGMVGIATVRPEFVAKDASIADADGNGDGVANPGEPVTARIRLRNTGFIDATDVRVALTSEDPSVSAGGSRWVGHWPVGETRTVSVSLWIASGASTHDVTTLVTVTASNGGPWVFVLVFPIDAPSTEFSKVEDSLSDPAPTDNADGEVNPGERVTVTVRLLNEGPSDATGVTVTLLVLDPDVTAVVSQAVHTSWPAGEERETSFLVDVSETAQTGDVPFFVTVETDEAGPWQFSVVVPIVGPEPDFVLRNSWAFDPTPRANGDRRVAPGERVFPRVRLANDGAGDAHGVRVTLSTSDADATVVNGEVSHGTWPAGVVRNNNGFIVDIAPDAQPHDVALAVDVVDVEGRAWRFDIVLPIIAPDVDFVVQNFWLLDPSPAGNDDGAANPGERVFPRVRLEHTGLDIAHDVTVALSVDDADVAVVSGSVTYVSLAPGDVADTVGLALDVARDAVPHDVTVGVTVTAAHVGSWQFSYTFAIAYRPVEFVLRNSWIFDPAPGGDRDGQAEAGERVLPRIRLKHVGTATAENVTVAISVDDPDVTVVGDQVSYVSWEPGTARTSLGLVLDIARDALPHDVALIVSVTSDAWEPWTAVAIFPVVAPAVEFVAVSRSVADSGPASSKNGFAEAGERVRPRIRLRQVGSETARNVRVALIVADPDVTVVIGQMFHATWPAGEYRENVDLKMDIASSALPHDLRVILSLTADGGGSWEFEYVIPVTTASRVVTTQRAFKDVVLDGIRDGNADAGDQVNATITITNFGPSDAQSVRTVVESDDPDIAVLTSEVTIGSLASGERADVGPFLLDISRDTTDHRATLRVRAYVGEEEPSISTTRSFRVAVPPTGFEYASTWIWDPVPGGNRDKAANPGETLRPRVRLVSTSVATARNVRATLLIDDPDVEVVSNLATYSVWPGGAGRNIDSFVVAIDPTATAHDVTAIVSVTADNGGPWQFTYTIPIVERAPEIARRSDWIWDGAPGGDGDRMANPGERMRWRLRLKNTGGTAQNLQASIVVNDDDVSIVKGVITHAEWPAGEARTNSFVLDIAPDATAHEVTATVSVTADNGGPWLFDISTTIVVPEVAATALLANFPNPFNPETWIPFDLAEDSDVTVRVYDVTGRQIRRLDLGWMPAGLDRRRATAAYWDGRNDVGERVSSGLYLYELRAGRHREMRRMIVRK